MFQSMTIFMSGKPHLFLWFIREIPQDSAGITGSAGHVPAAPACDIPSFSQEYTLYKWQN
jgi:hypothetical protein